MAKRSALRDVWDEPPHDVEMRYPPELAQLVRRAYSLTPAMDYDKHEGKPGKFFADYNMILGGILTERYMSEADKKRAVAVLKAQAKTIEKRLMKVHRAAV